MNNSRNTSFFRKSIAVAAALVICLSLSLTALAATGVLKGYFRDIKNFSGAIIGTTYEQATDEIDLEVTVDGEKLTVVAMFDSSRPPFSESEKMGIAAYRIVDAEGTVIKEGASEQVSDVADGQAAIDLRLDDIANGSYKLIVTAFVSEKKADQPLAINGVWECEFTK